MIFIKYNSTLKLFNVMVELPGYMLNEKQKILAKKMPDTWLFVNGSAAAGQAKEFNG